MEWDTGAGQAVLEAAGGRVVALDPDAARRVRSVTAKPASKTRTFMAWGR
jgi:3'-phosphoadenosine 5'-phosphosulfate (PAPS) 3'-phosphatase